MYMEAVDMYSRAGRWEAAQKVARGYLSDGEMRSFYRWEGRNLCLYFMLLVASCKDKRWSAAKLRYICVCAIELQEEGTRV